MKRDMDLIREILLYAERQTQRWHAGKAQIEGWKSTEVVYNVGLCVDRGFLRAEPLRGSEIRLKAVGPDWVVERLTYDGHEFLDNIRNDGIWSQVKSAAKNKGVDLTFDLAIMLAKQALAKLFSDDAG